MMNISPEEDPNRVAIQKVIFHVGDCLRIIEYTFQTRQDVPYGSRQVLPARYYLPPTAGTTFPGHEIIRVFGYA